jgi:Tfp pilus assembly protein PilF
MAQGNMAAAESNIDFALHCDCDVPQALMAKYRLLIKQGNSKDAWAFFDKAQKKQGYVQPE